MNISSSKPLSDSDVRSCLKTLSVMLNKRSTGADEDGMARYREARIARFWPFLFVRSPVLERVAGCFIEWGLGEILLDIRFG